MSVSDTGIGIPEADLPFVFERFYRAKRSRAANPGGSGLGLSIVRWIVEAHKGRVSVESTVGKGSTFTVHFPRRLIIRPPHETRIRISAARTPIGKFGGAFASLSPAELGEAAARAAHREIGPSAGRGGRDDLRSRAAGGRRAEHRAAGVARRAGVPDAVPAFTVNKACALVAQGHHARGPDDRRRRERRGSGGRDRVHVGDAVSADAGPLRAAHGPRRDRGRHVPRRLPLPALRPAHGRDGRDAGARVRHPARRAGRLRGRDAAARGRGDPRPAASRRRSSPVSVAGRKGPRRGRGGRAPAARHEPRGARRGSRRSSTRRGRSTPATPPGSRTARRRSCSPPRRRRARPASSRSPGSWPGRRPASIPRAWVSARSPRSARFSRRRSCALDEIDLIELNEAFAAQIIACARDLSLDPREGQRQRRGDRPRPSHRGDGRADRDDSPARDEAPRRPHAASRPSACRAGWGWRSSSSGPRCPPKGGRP